MSRRDSLARACVLAWLLLAWIARPGSAPPSAHATSEEALARVPLALPGAPALPTDVRGRLASALAARGPDYVPRTRNLRPDGSPIYTNRLLLEPSPYLQQHAHNPVNWYPWGDAAFEAAAALDRPVLVSIGYSTCHWCHVMEEESFDDPVVAELLNASFVAIKVDREVRPDVDSIYMTALHAMNQRGGWPLNVWLTPERKPFFGGTYFPPTDRRGRPGLTTVLETIRDRYAESPERIAQAAAQLAASISRELAGTSAASTRVPDASALSRAASVYIASADPTWGGIGRQTKFPSSFPIRFLLRYHRRTGDEQSLSASILTLEKMAAGGMYDHLGGGFHRYSTDPRWLVPHFEKMLYDNALLAVAYLEAGQVTGRADLTRVARETLDYVARELVAPEGAFYSATDADSAGPDGELEEGRFFTWTPAELDRALDAETAAAAKAWYGVSDAGDYEGRSVLHTWRTAEEVAGELGVEPEALAATLERARERLLEVRSRRPAPLRDEKILAAWNGLMISAFARAGFVLDEPAYARAAARAADFVLTRMREDGRLVRVFKGGQAGGPSFLEDYAFVIAGLIDLYEADPDPRWLREALALQSVLDAHHADEAGGGYFKVADDHEALLAREKPGDDGAIPSGNSVTALNLLRLGELSTDDGLLDRAALLFSAFYDALTRRPMQLSELLLALDYQLDRALEIVIVEPGREPADEDGALAEMLAPLRARFVPNRVLAVVTEGDDMQAHAALAPWVGGRIARGGEVTAYVCEDRVCGFPTSDPAVFAKQISEVKRLPEAQPAP